MSNQGWVKIHRKIQDWPLYLSEPFTKAQAWIDLFLLANHKDGIIQIRGNIIDIKRGQLGYSEVSLAKRWQWSRNKVRRFLKWLETEQQIEQQKLATTSIITLVQYEAYQENGTADDTAERQQKDIRRNTNKNDKNDKNDKKKTEDTLPPLGEFKNVKLSEPELAKLKEKLGPVRTTDMIERLSGYIASKGKNYKSHYAALLNWSRRDNVTKPSASEETKPCAGHGMFGCVTC